MRSIQHKTKFAGKMPELNEAFIRELIVSFELVMPEVRRQIANFEAKKNAGTLKLKPSNNPLFSE
jgi:hypothetical protein